MFDSCSREEGLSFAESVSNSRRSKLNQVSLSTALLGSLIKAKSLLSTPFEGMCKFTPFGSFESMKVPSDAMLVEGTTGAGATGAGATGAG